MAQQEVDDEFSRLWQRHLDLLRDEFSASSLQVLPSTYSESPSLDGGSATDEDAWEDGFGSTGNALGVLTLYYSPSPSACWETS